MILEICSGSLTSAIEAQKGGAHRVELCDNLREGGTTPSPGIIKQAVKLLQIPVFVLIRPRAGDFLYSDKEFDAMKDDVLFCKEHGVKGIVFGILNPNGQVDIERCAQMIQLARPMEVTFHRAFDMVKEPFIAMEDLISLGVSRILTSGQAESAPGGCKLISELIILSAERIIIMPGGGINENNFIELKQKTGAVEFHASLRNPVKSQMLFYNKNTFMGSPGENEYSWMETSSGKVKVIVKLMYG